MEEVKQKISPQNTLVSPNTSPPVIQTPTIDKDVKTTPADNEQKFDLSKLSMEDGGKIKLGCGSNGETSVVRGIYNDKPVAVKCFPLNSKRNALIHEATVTNGLPSDYLAPILGYSLEPPRIIMELYEQTLSGLLKNIGKFPWSKRHRLLLDIALGIATLRYHGLIHGDIKSENIFIDDTGRALLGDFGTTKPPHQADKDPPLGTVGYAAPELLKPDKTVTFASDVHSFGATCWEVIHGRKIRDEGSEFLDWAYDKDSYKKSPNEDKRQLHFPPGTPTDLIKLTQYCLAKNPANRPSIDEVAERLETLWQNAVNEEQAQQSPKKKEEKLLPSIAPSLTQFSSVFSSPKPETSPPSETVNWLKKIMLERALRLIDTLYPANTKYAKLREDFLKELPGDSDNNNNRDKLRLTIMKLEVVQELRRDPQKAQDDLRQALSDLTCN